MKLKQIDTAGNYQEITWTDGDTIALYNAALQFSCRFTDWIRDKSSDTKLETALMFGNEFEALLDALKIPEAK